MLFFSYNLGFEPCNTMFLHYVPFWNPTPMVGIRHTNTVYRTYSLSMAQTQLHTYSACLRFVCEYLNTVSELNLQTVNFPLCWLSAKGVKAADILRLIGELYGINIMSDGMVWIWAFQDWFALWLRRLNATNRNQKLIRSFELGKTWSNSIQPQFNTQWLLCKNDCWNGCLKPHLRQNK